MKALAGSVIMRVRPDIEAASTAYPLVVRSAAKLRVSNHEARMWRRGDLVLRDACFARSSG
jgi:hypothetical protein